MIGAEAPDFTLKNQHGEDVRLSSFRGERNVAVVFYPFAFSGVCTSELQAIRDNPDAFGDAEVLVVSCDPMFALRAWADAEKFEFSLLSDFWPHGAAASAYGVLDGDHGCALRGSFIIDRDGKVAWSVVNELPDARDLEDYRKALAELG